MNEHAMTQGVIPVRHSSLPGVIKLPKRYEKAALGDPRTARHRKVSIVCTGPTQMRETISDRLDDLMTAIMWVKQELILLRQHDILLKRQFFNIHDSIKSLQPKKTLSASSTLSSTPNGVITTNGDINDCLPSHSTVESTSYSSPTSPARIRAAIGLNFPLSHSNSHLETFLVRQSSSATVLNNDNDSDDTDGDDTFDDEYFRPRTSSMRTSRDLAALARRRGSKELI